MANHRDEPKVEQHRAPEAKADPAAPLDPITTQQQQRGRAAQRAVEDWDRQRAVANEMTKHDEVAAAAAEKEAAEAEKAPKTEEKPVMARYKALREGHIPNAKLGSSRVGTIAPGEVFDYGGVPGAWMEPLDEPAKAAKKKRDEEVAERERKALAVRNAAETLAGVAAR